MFRLGRSNLVAVHSTVRVGVRCTAPSSATGGVGVGVGVGSSCSGLGRRQVAVQLRWLSESAPKPEGAPAAPRVRVFQPELEAARRRGAEKLAAAARADAKPPPIGPFMLAFGAMTVLGGVFVYQSFGGFPSLTASSQATEAEQLDAIPLYAGNPVVYLDVEAEGQPLGRLVLQLRADVCPKAAENFRVLCTNDAGAGYKGTKLHRLVKSNLVQGGDYTQQSGMGSQSSFGEPFEDENFQLLHKGIGVLAMANSGFRDSNGSQFFISLRSMPYCDGRYVAFGNLVSGVDVLHKIDKYSSISGIPTGDVYIKDCGQLVLPPDAPAPPAPEAKHA